ncbi:hypothetical protein AWB99_08370 [Mycolicibacterium confluentis]|uniref:Uncharacterized protein n=1 Tax=Mycolicibacterium confluentis TaxID=28047 RepID=A0A7I7XS76_9MYCO|nr:hypothetical protein AWB99_08370 [Mycolicibacterium confluentis]BBZ32075.1 hypothetical protein MCNF_06800 [Mycolicibacterium confluentis]
MKFERSEQPGEYGNDDTYEFLDNGVLRLSFSEPAQWDEYYAPHAWYQVVAEEKHRPGATGGS